MDAEEAMEFLRDYGLEEPGLNRLIRKGYKELGLITFLTAGEKEVRAWTVREGTAPTSGRRNPHRLRAGFYPAEVIDWDKLVQAEGQCRREVEGMAAHGG